MRQIQPRERYYLFPSFGFSADGRYLIRILSQNITGVKAYLLPQRYDSFSGRLLLNPTDLCNGDFSIPPYASFSPEADDTWDGHITSSRVLVPLVVNCGGMKPTVTIKMTNKGTLLDAREQGIPVMYLTLTFIYAAISIVFLINQCIFSDFVIGLHMWLGVSAILKAFTCHAAAELWETKAVSGDYRTKLDSPSMKEISHDFLFIISHSILFSVGALAVMGFWIYREIVPLEEATKIGALALFFFGSWTTMGHITSRVLFMFFFTLSALSLIIYAMCIHGANRATVRMYMMMLSIERPVMVLKLNLAIKFSQMVSVWMVSLFFVWIYFLYTPSWRFLFNFVHEMYILVLYVINMVCFLYRKEFRERGEREIVGDETEDTAEDEEKRIIALVEPENESFVYLSRADYENCL